MTLQLLELAGKLLVLTLILLQFLGKGYIWIDCASLAVQSCGKSRCAAISDLLVLYVKVVDGATANVLVTRSLTDVSSLSYHTL